MNPLTDYFRSMTLLHSQSWRNPYNWTFYKIRPGFLPPTSIRMTCSCNLPCQHPCHMDMTHHPICTSPIPWSNNGPVSHSLPVSRSLLAHRHMVFSNQIQLCLCDLSEGHTFLIGFSIVIAFLAVTGRHFSHLHTNSTSKVIELLISWPEVGCQSKSFKLASHWEGYCGLDYSICWRRYGIG
jgi:hypothetical protein